MSNMDWKQYLFSFQGRVARAQWWLMVLLSIVVGAVAARINLSTSGDPRYGIGGILELAMLWVTLAVAVKRWHDRDKSGWWVLIYIVPIIGWLWVLIENGFLQGTAGPNRFGEDPLRVAAARS
jgi:uncharacterized membrane protein YhaH (DUF805 family)